MIRRERKEHGQKQSLVLPRLYENRLTHSGLLSARLLLCMGQTPLLEFATRPHVVYSNGTACGIPDTV